MEAIPVQPGRTLVHIASMKSDLILVPVELRQHYVQIQSSVHYFYGQTFLGVTRGWRDSCGNHWVSCLFFTDEYVLLAPYSMPPGHSLQEVFQTCPTRTRSQGRSTTCWSEYVTLLALEPRAVFRASLPRPLPPQPSTRSSGSRWRDRWRTLC